MVIYGSKISMALGSAFGVLGTIPAVPAAMVATILVGELWFKQLEKGDERA